jgi:hypothetical protein
MWEHVGTWLLIALAVAGGGPPTGSRAARERERTRYVDAEREAKRDQGEEARDRTQGALGGPQRTKGTDEIAQHVVVPGVTAVLEPTAPRSRPPIVESIARRDRLLDGIPKQTDSVRKLEPRRRGSEVESEFEGVLRTLGVDDYWTVATSFDSRALIKDFVLSEDVVLLRLFGQGSKAVGRFYFCCLISAGPFQSAKWADATGLALPPQNSTEQFGVVTLPAGTRIFTGVVADNFMSELGVKKRGGGTQFFVPFPGTLPVEIYGRVTDRTRASELALITGDGNVVRYRLEKKEGEH